MRRFTGDIHFICFMAAEAGANFGGIVLSRFNADGMVEGPSWLVLLG